MVANNTRIKMLIYSDHHHSSIKKYTYNYNDSLNPPALDFNFERAVGGFNPHCEQKVEPEKS